MANSFLRIALLFSTLAGFSYGKLCTDEPGCNRENNLGVALITPAVCTQLDVFFDMKNRCPGRCGGACCDFYSNCNGLSNPIARCAADAALRARCPETCNTCVPPVSSPRLVSLMTTENCVANTVPAVAVTWVNPFALPVLVAQFRCCFDNTLQVCNDPVVQCPATAAAELATRISFEQAELTCKFRGGHLCSAEETRAYCCIFHKCSFINNNVFTAGAMWLGSSRPATLSTVPPPIVPTAVPTMAPPPPTAAPTPAPTVAPTTTGCRDNYPPQCARLSTYNNFQSMCNSEGAYRRMCKKSCGVC